MMFQFCFVTIFLCLYYKVVVQYCTGILNYNKKDIEKREVLLSEFTERSPAFLACTRWVISDSITLRISDFLRSEDDSRTTTLSKHI